MHSDVQTPKCRTRRSFFGTKRTGTIEIVFDADREARSERDTDVGTDVGSQCPVQGSEHEREGEEQDTSGTELSDSSSARARRTGIRQLFRRSTTRLLSVFWGRGSAGRSLRLVKLFCTDLCRYH